MPAKAQGSPKPAPGSGLWADSTTRQFKAEAGEQTGDRGEVRLLDLQSQTPGVGWVAMPMEVWL